MTRRKHRKGPNWKGQISDSPKAITIHDLNTVLPASGAKSSKDWYMLVENDHVQVLPMPKPDGKSITVFQIGNTKEDMARYASFVNSAAEVVKIGSVRGETLLSVLAALQQHSEAVTVVTGWNEDGSPQLGFLYFDDYRHVPPVNDKLIANLRDDLTICLTKRVTAIGEKAFMPMIYQTRQSQKECGQPGMRQQFTLFPLKDGAPAGELIVVLFRHYCLCCFEDEYAHAAKLFHDMIADIRSSSVPLDLMMLTPEQVAALGQVSKDIN